MLENYWNLIAKVDDKFAEISAKAGTSMLCKLGCHSCCAPGLTISKIEAVAIRRKLEEDADLRKSVQSVEEENPHAGARCRFLGATGACSIYEVRPIICRSHGVPIRFRQEEELKRDVCELNFIGQNLDDIDEGMLVNLDLLNTLLALVNEKEFGKDGRERVSLTYESIMSEG